MKGASETVMGWNHTVERPCCGVVLPLTTGRALASRRLEIIGGMISISKPSGRGGGQGPRPRDRCGSPRSVQRWDKPQRGPRISEGGGRGGGEIKSGQIALLSGGRVAELNLTRQRLLSPAASPVTEEEEFSRGLAGFRD